MSEWKEYKLGEIADVQTGPFGSQLHMSDYQDEGTPIITVEHLGDNRIIHNNLPLVGDDDKERLKKYVLKEGDIVFSRVGSVDRRAYVSPQEDGWLFSGRCLRVRPSQQVDAKFLSYYFGLEDFKETIRRIAVGATMPSINTSILKDVSILLPPLSTQNHIASILSSIDDKINLLCRENTTLEQMAETIFKQWFVEEAKVEWKEKTLSYYGKIVCGKTPPKKESRFFGGETPFIKIPDMHNKTFVLFSEDSLTKEGVLYQKDKTLPPFSVIVSCIATVGLVVMNAKEAQTNQQINSIIPYKEEYRYFLYLHLKNMYDDLNAMASGGTATLNLNTSNFSNIKIAYPTDDILYAFHNQVSVLFEKIYSNQKQIQTLIQTRDGLLLKMMSNKIKL